MIVAVDLERQKSTGLEVENVGAVTLGVSFLLESVKVNGKDVHHAEAPVYIGRGPYANYSFMGANRAVATFFSPLTGGVFVSSAGGVARALSAAGIDGILIRGRSSQPVAVAVTGDGKNVEVKVLAIDGLEEVFREGGAYALIELLEDEVGKDVPGYHRVGAVGPGAIGTRFGSVVFYEKTMETHDFFGRGGLGSVLAEKNVFGLVMGGSAPDPEVDERILERLKEMDTFKPTEKYRMVVSQGVGGTIYNWFTLKALLPALNWNTIYMSEREREEIYEDYVKPLTEEIRRRFKEGKIRSKTCGEKCVAVCKKMDGKKKVEYEPFTSLGLQIGVFDYERILSLTDLVNAYGLDAIETGDAIALYIDSIDQGINEGKASLVDIDPERNHEFAVDFVERLVKGELPLSEGVARGARSMGLKELAVYVPTREGGLTPPQYWNPGFHVGLPLIGKFMTYYHNDDLDGKAWGRKAGERFMKELNLEDLGICRFHRGWVEKLFDVLGVDDGYLKETVLTIKLLNALRGGYVKPPEGRASDLIKTYFRLFGRDVDPWKWYFEAKEGIDEAVPTLESQ